MATGTTITVDLTKNPELAALVADMEPGDWITLDASIKNADAQTLTARLERCDACEKPDDAEDEEDEDEGDDAPGMMEKTEPKERIGRRIANRLGRAPEVMT